MTFSCKISKLKYVMASIWHSAQKKVKITHLFSPLRTDISSMSWNYCRLGVHKLNWSDLESRVRIWPVFKVSLLGVLALWGDCTFIPADWGVIKVDLCYVKPNSRTKAFFSHSNYLPDKFYQKKIGNWKN